MAHGALGTPVKNRSIVVEQIVMLIISLFVLWFMAGISLIS